MRSQGWAIALCAIGCDAERRATFLVPPPQIFEPIPPEPPPSTRPPPPESDDELFTATRVLEVDLFLPEEDWEVLRRQAISPMFYTREDCQAGRFPDPFVAHRATVVVDRKVLEDVAVEKRGFLFSENEYRPSLELRFGQHVSGRTLAGRSELILEAGIYDPAAMRACLAYAIFRDAGVPAPRCSFAHLRVNGVSYGIYANVERVDDSFVARHFEEGGDLFEGKASDFRAGWLATFEGGGDPSSLSALASALEQPDADLIAALEGVVDLDAFHRFWAVETLIGHFDGYAGNADRYFAYRDPSRGFVFVPAGTEMAFRADHPLLRGSQPASVYAQGELARRLYLLPEGRQRHLAEVTRLLDEAWDEDAIVAEIDRIEALVTPLEPWRPNLLLDVQALRSFVRSRRDAIEAELEIGGVDWTVLRRPTFCFVPRGRVVVSFETSFESFGPDPFSTGSSTVSAVFDERSFAQIAAGGAVAGSNPERPGIVELFTIVQTSATTGAATYVVMPLEAFTPGPHPFGEPIYGALLEAMAGQELEVVGWMGGGAIELDAASTEPGGRVAGRLTADLY